MAKYLIVLSFFITCKFNYTAQDTLKVVYYNLLDFPISQPDRVDTLKKIMDYIQPDVLVVNELTSFNGGVQIKDYTLNVNGVNHYTSATFIDGPDTDNLLFYNSNKLGLVSQTQIPTALRDINEYIMYHKDPSLPLGGDTTYLYFYSLHLKAGSQQNEMDQRFIEAQVLKSYLNTNNRTTNLIVGGDFNFYTPLEAGCQQIVNGQGLILNDPLNLMGQMWHDNIAYKSYHTQSTRYMQGYAGGSEGGMDDRFDFMFVTNDILSGSSGVQYVPSSYTTIGQDGLHFDSNIHIPANNSVPQSVATALYYMSDHLPIYMELVTGGDVGIINNNEIIHSAFINLHQELEISLIKPVNSLEIKIIDMSGKLIISKKYFDSYVIKEKLNFLPYGLYIASVVADKKHSNFKFIINKN